MPECMCGRIICGVWWSLVKKPGHFGGEFNLKHVRAKTWRRCHHTVGDEDTHAMWKLDHRVARRVLVDERIVHDATDGVIRATVATEAAPRGRAIIADLRLAIGRDAKLREQSLQLGLKTERSCRGEVATGGACAAIGRPSGSVGMHTLRRALVALQYPVSQGDTLHRTLRTEAGVECNASRSRD